MVRALLRELVDGAHAVRLRRFFLVGLVAAGVQTVLLWLFVDWADVQYLVAAAVAIEITILFQFFLNNAWTFADSRRTGLLPMLRGMLRTNVVRGTAIPIQLGALYGIMALGGVHYLVANGGAIAISGVYRYVFDARWTWS